MTKIKGIFAASVSILNKDLSLNIEKTINHCEKLIENGCHGVAIFGSTGQSQLISVSEKINLLNELSNNKFKNKFLVGTGLNSLTENINLLKISISLGFQNFLIMPPAYYKYFDNDVFNYYQNIVDSVPEAKIILYNFEKLCGYKFSVDLVQKLIKNFPENIIGVKDSSYNLYKELDTKNFSILPGSELKLSDGLELGCSGIITATCNLTGPLARKVFDDFFNKKKDQSSNDQLCKVRKIFDNFNLISGIHSFLSQVNNSYENILPPLSLLSPNDKKKLIDDLNKINFNINSLKVR